MLHPSFCLLPSWSSLSSRVRHVSIAFGIDPCWFPGIVYAYHACLRWYAGGDCPSLFFLTALFHALDVQEFALDWSSGLLCIMRSSFTFVAWYLVVGLVIQLGFVADENADSGRREDWSALCGFVSTCEDSEGRVYLIRVVGEVVVVVVLGGKDSEQQLQATTSSQQHSSMCPSSSFCRTRHAGRTHSASVGDRSLVLAVRVLAVKVVCWWQLSRCMIGSNASNTCRLQTSSQQLSRMFPSSFFCHVRYVTMIYSAAIPARVLVLWYLIRVLAMKLAYRQRLFQYLVGSNASNISRLTASSCPVASSMSVEPTRHRSVLVSWCWRYLIRVLAVEVVCWRPLSRCMVASNTSNTCRLMTSFYPLASDKLLESTRIDICSFVSIGDTVNPCLQWKECVGSRCSSAWSEAMQATPTHS